MLQAMGSQRVGHNLATEQQTVKFMGPRHFKMVLTASAKKTTTLLRSQWPGTRDISWGRAVRNHEGSNSELSLHWGMKMLGCNRYQNALESTAQGCQVHPRAPQIHTPNNSVMLAPSTGAGRGDPGLPSPPGS